MAENTDQDDEHFSYPLMRQNSNNNSVWRLDVLSPQPVGFKHALGIPRSIQKVVSSIDPRLKAAKHPARIIAFIVGSAQPFGIGTPSVSHARSFFIPENLITNRSALVAEKLSDPGSTENTTSTIHLPNSNPSAFQDFVDYLHSSIYSPNSRAADFHPLRTHMSSWILGAELKSPAYQDAAAMKLHFIFSTLFQSIPDQSHLPALVRGIGKKRSPITAKDIEYVCTQTAPSSQLRTLFFDAVTSHWTQFEVLNIGNDIDTAQGTAWLEVYTDFADFRSTMALSMKIVGAQRKGFLGGVEEYLVQKGGGWKSGNRDEDRGRFRKRKSNLSVAVSMEAAAKSKNPFTKTWVETGRMNPGGREGDGKDEGGVSIDTADPLL